MDCHGSSQHLETTPSPEQNPLLERHSAQLDQSETQAARSSFLEDSTEITDGVDMLDSIARATKKAIDVGRIYSDDKQDTSTAEFWLRSYVSHLKVAYE